MASHRHTNRETEPATSGKASSPTTGQGSHVHKTVKSRQSTERDVTHSAGAISLATPTEHTASLSSSPRSRSSSLASNAKSPESTDNCFMCFLRLQENDELEQRLSTYRETQKKLEDEIVMLTEKAETSAAEFETLAALYHADQKDLHERLNLLEANNSILETSFIEVEQENAGLMAQLQQTESRTNSYKFMQAELNDDIDQHSATPEASGCHTNDLIERVSALEEENSILRKSVNDLENEKVALEECIQRGAQRSRELRRSRRELEDVMFNLKNESESKAIEYERQAAISLADMNSLQHRIRFLEEENLIIARSCNDLKAEKGIIEVKLKKAAARADELQSRVLDLEIKILRLQEQATAVGNDFDSISALSFEARHDIDEQSKLVEEDSSILQRSFDYLEKENAAFEAKLQDAEVRAATNLALTHKTHVNEQKLLRERIVELVREKGDVVRQFENALKLTNVELQEERRVCNQISKDMDAAQAEVAVLSQLAETRLIEQTETKAQLLDLEHKMHERMECYEASINAYEAELESRVLVTAETEAANARLLDEVARLSSLLTQQANSKELEELLDQMRLEADWYKTIAKEFEAELEYLQQHEFQCAEDEDLISENGTNEGEAAFNTS